jgi:hypothetical protein
LRLADAAWDNGRLLDLAGLDQAAAPVQPIRLRRRKWRALRLAHQAQDDVAVALAGLPRGAELFDISRIEPHVNSPLGARLCARSALGVRRGYHGIGGGRDREPDQRDAALLSRTPADRHGELDAAGLKGRPSNTFTKLQK